MIQLFGTGFGALTEPGRFPSDKLSPISNTAGIRIGGQPAEIAYIGGASGQIAAVFQVNAIIPLSAASGPQQVELTGQLAISTAPVTIRVR